MGAVIAIPWRRVRPMPDQPRGYFDPDALRELAASIAAVGQVIPAQVCPLPGGGRHDYELIDGQRRWHAVQAAGLETLKAEVVDEPDPERRFVLSVVANFSRQENHHMEVARAVGRMRRAMSVEQIRATLGKSDAYVRQHLALLDLHPDLADMLHPATPPGHRLAFSVAVRLAPMARDRQLEAFQKIRASGLSQLRASSVVLAAMPASGKQRPHAKKARDEFRVLVGMLSRAALELEAHSLDWYAALIAGRAPPSRAAARGLLARLVARAKELEGMID